MPDMVKIAAIAVAAALCAVVVKKNVAELGMVLALCAGAIILSCSLGALEGVKELMDTLADTAGLSPAVLAPVVKTVGIAVLTRVSAELCRDAKEGGIAAFVETAGAAAALFVSLPLLKTVLSMVTGLL
ncbi:SpoIIIAC/SpoIIIAD family protein [Intestinimonas butyriciproducens]|uniref:SpoIIIAC/SpoIIIAD family protein n=2 Tax=Intestinimonas butyriciproducens TaxID=1297617 RepID=UPI00051BBE08|nr:SpoIIIAC/SpoIIIAD family protein [Intestinimonas butyriciproducens]MBS6523900.1 stage III sporulation protein AD [Clostridiales bacterium]MDB7816130.1 SpoIIIAC/SpoIIIAD family protein [Intestinimonas butyriciproducens]MDB7843100.1 SpoIIIAC/SpoIIIAD family protein [Intestinimonas butyriciproducens]MDB7857152.1 SpoIIIAC/SpoIIIAD family protein [Intestinimonas butyriciproducens]